jgi:hypothetical protein
MIWFEQGWNGGDGWILSSEVILAVCVEQLILGHAYDEYLVLA